MMKDNIYKQILVFIAKGFCVASLIIFIILLALTLFVSILWRTEGYTIVPDQQIDNCNYNEIQNKEYMFNEATFAPELGGVSDDGIVTVQVNAYSDKPVAIHVTSLRIIDHDTNALISEISKDAEIETKLIQDDECCFGYIVYDRLIIQEQYLKKNNKFRVILSVNADRHETQKVKELEYVFNVDIEKGIAWPT